MKEPKIQNIKIIFAFHSTKGTTFHRKGEGVDLIAAVEAMLLKKGSENVDMRNVVWNQIREFSKYLGYGARRTPPKRKGLAN